MEPLVTREAASPDELLVSMSVTQLKAMERDPRVDLFLQWPDRTPRVVWPWPSARHLRRLKETGVQFVLRRRAGR